MFTLAFCQKSLYKIRTIIEKKKNINTHPTPPYRLSGAMEI